MRHRLGCFAVCVIAVLFMAACFPAPATSPSLAVPSPSPTCGPSPTLPPTATRAPTLSASATALPTPTSVPTLAPSPTASPTPTPAPTARVKASIDIVAYQVSRGGTWFTTQLQDLPDASAQAEVAYTLEDQPISNRRDGQIASTLVARYVFLQFGDIRPDLLERYAPTMRALFIRSALMSFVDYEGNRVLDWWGHSSPIPMDLKGVIELANRLNIPVYLELNYSDFIPGPIGTGIEALQPADNIARTLDYLRELQGSGLRLEGLTFGDEIGDESGFGPQKPTLQTSDLAARFVAVSRALKTAFPALEMYAFDSYISAARGQLSLYYPLLQQIRQAEVESGQVLLDGFMYRESYTYIDEKGKLLDSQHILDDSESLYRDAPVYRYDTMGLTYPHPDRNYLNTVIQETERIFGRDLETGLTEYLPAGPTQIDESDTSPYADIDFTLHYADMIGIYGTLGLDVVSTWIFANSNQQAECYLDRSGNEGLGFPVHDQLARYFAGTMLQVDQAPEKVAPRIRAYAAREGGRTFVMILNKDVADAATVRVFVPGELDLTMVLPRRSYTSLVVEEGQVMVSGIGN